jgi:hypothetical protein
MEKQQTAVEWLQEQLECFGNKHELQISWTTLDELFDQAKEMEKEKMIDAIIFSEREHYIMGECWPTQTVVDKAERYYNETFKNK